MNIVNERAEQHSTKADLRRRQVIMAAADCFRREGFSGASIARISKAAGMSPGHIYHYFPNKELIVAAIVEEEESELADLIRSIERDCGTTDFLILVCNQVEDMVERSLEPDRLSLMLEITAEASRNPKIAEILQESDRRLAQRFVTMANMLGGITAANPADDADLRARLEVLPVLFSGIAVRSVHNAKLDRPRMAKLIKDILKNAWSKARPGDPASSMSVSSAEAE